MSPQQHRSQKLPLTTTPEKVMAAFGQLTAPLQTNASYKYLTSLGTHAQKVLQTLDTELGSPDPLRKVTALRMCSSMGFLATPLVPKIRVLLLSEDEASQVRYDALFALAGIGGREAAISLREFVVPPKHSQVDVGLRSPLCDHGLDAMKFLGISGAHILPDILEYRRTLLETPGCLSAYMTASEVVRDLMKHVGAATIRFLTQSSKGLQRESRSTPVSSSQGWDDSHSLLCATEGSDTVAMRGTLPRPRDGYGKILDTRVTFSHGPAYESLRIRLFRDLEGLIVCVSTDEYSGATLNAPEQRLTLSYMGPLATILRKELNLPPETGWLEHFTDPSNEPVIHTIRDVRFTPLANGELQVATWHAHSLESTSLMQQLPDVRRDLEKVTPPSPEFIKHLIFREEFEDGLAAATMRLSR